jgi:ParB family chromosome partitioning protein
MENKEIGKITEINIQDIIEPEDPMRSSFDEDKIAELAESIKKQGLINPITVRPVGDKFEIVAGHRRFKACIISKIYVIPCVIREMTDSEVFSMRAHENLFRDDVDPVDEALYIGKLIGEDDSKIPEIAGQLNRSVQWVKDRLEILTYPDYFLPNLKAGRIKIGVAKALAQVGDEVYRRMFFDTAIRDGMTVWQADYYLSQWQNGVFKYSSDILPAPVKSGENKPAVIRQQCAKCGQMAESPNLQNVFIHIECPNTEPEKPA